jgi:hypothetical protein
MDGLRQPSSAIPSPCSSTSPASFVKLPWPALRVHDLPGLTPGVFHRHILFWALTLPGQRFFPRACPQLLLPSDVPFLAHPSISCSTYCSVQRIYCAADPPFLPEFPKKIVQPNFVANLPCSSQFLHITLIAESL